MIRALGVLALLALATCRSAPAVRPLVADDHDRLIALMGGIDSHLLEIQGAAADPIEPERLRTHLDGMRRSFEKAAALEIPHASFRDRARDAVLAVLELEGRPWTAVNRDEGYATLRGLCAGCHRAFAPPAAVEVRKPDSKQACAGCHRKVYEDWKGTLHARAWVDPVYRLSAGDPPKMECRGCHSMEPILEREISTDVTYRPVYRPYNHEDGVGCQACHGLSGGSVAAARDLPGAPCGPRRDDRLRSPEFCGACHNPSHLAYDEWKRSSSGKSCVDCHAMRDGKFSHRMRGVDDPDFVRGGLGWSCEIVGAELRISLTNKSGHRLPAEVPSRMLRVLVRLDEREEQVVFRRPNKQIVGEKDNRLLPDETRILTRPLGGATRVRVEILYQQAPFAPPKDWIVMGRWMAQM